MYSASVLRHKIVYRVGRALVAPFILKKYTYKTDYVPKVDGPYIFMSNHTTEADIAMVARASRHHMYYVCGEHLLRGKWGKELKIFFDPITIPKGGQTLSAVKEISRRVKQGFNILLFPEGNRSFNGETEKVEVSTGKLLKFTKCALITYRTQGGYFIAPRWGLKFRRGHAEGKVMGVYSADELDKMSAEEITDIINRDLYENAYVTQREKMYKYECEAPAEGLENYLIKCPGCGAYDKLETKGEKFKCPVCGLNGIYDEYGFLRGEGLPYDNVYDWGKWIEKKFHEDVKEMPSEEKLFTDPGVRLYEIKADTHGEADIGTGDLDMYHDRMEICGKTFSYKSISAMAMNYFGRTAFFTCPEGYFGITGERLHAWKAHELYNMYKNPQENL